MPIALLDIDGCCVDSTFRNEHVDVDFARYLALHTTDKPILQGVLIYSMLMEIPDMRCIFITSRGEEQRETTEALLATMFDGHEYEVLMRAEGDRRKDAIVKREIIEKAGIEAEDVFIAFDDRPVIVDMYREMGIVAYQTAVGY